MYTIIKYVTIISQPIFQSIYPITDYDQVFQLFFIVSLIQSIKNATFVNTSGFPGQGRKAQDTTPTITYSLSSFLATTPPPESPCENIITHKFI